MGKAVEFGYRIEPVSLFSYSGNDNVHVCAQVCVCVCACVRCYLANSNFFLDLKFPVWLCISHSFEVSAQIIHFIPHYNTVDGISSIS